MPEYLGLVAGGNPLELRPALHLLELPEDAAGIGLLQHGQPDLFDVAAGIAQRMSGSLHGRDDLWIGWPEEARRCLSLGAYLSFSGIVSFKTADDVRGAAALCPSDRIMVETDSPYLAPVPHRGKSNEPAYVPLVGQVLATVRGVSLSTISSDTYLNTAVAFGLPRS